MSSNRSSNILCCTGLGLFKSQRISKLHRWLNSYAFFDERVNFAYWLSCIRKGVQSTGLPLNESLGKNTRRKTCYMRGKLTAFFPFGLFGETFCLFVSHDGRNRVVLHYEEKADMSIFQDKFKRTFFSLSNFIKLVSKLHHMKGNCSF